MGGESAFDSAVGVSSHQSFDDYGNLSLLTSRKLGRFLEDATHLADRTGSALFHIIRSDEIFNRYAENIGQLLQLIRSQRYRMPFPPCISGMLHAQPIGNLLLRQSGDLSQNM